MRRIKSVGAVNQKKYDALNEIKAIACFMVVIIHMKAQNNYQIKGYFYNNFLPLSTYVVMLFMTISAFGLCCGYHKKILDNKIDFSTFYKKRVQKILPFFGLLVLIDVISEHSIKALYEGFADLTLVFGFTNKNLSVIGVGWFIGIIFVFYMIFPFFCVITKDKKSAWISLAIAVLWTIASINYFHLGRLNILYSGSFFIAGALIYLYRERLEKINRWLWLGVMIIVCVFYYLYHPHKIFLILVVSVILIYAIVLQNSKLTILNNKFVTFISGISLEIYLSHMFIFRIIQKLGLSNRFGNGVVQYTITVLLVLIGSIIFSFVVSKIIKYIATIINRFALKEGKQGSRE